MQTRGDRRLALQDIAASRARTVTSHWKEINLVLSGHLSRVAKPMNVGINTSLRSSGLSAGCAGRTDFDIKSPEGDDEVTISTDIATMPPTPAAQNGGLAPQIEATMGTAEEMSDKFQGRDLFYLLVILALLYHTANLLRPFAEAWAKTGADWWIYRKKKSLEKAEETEKVMSI